MFDLEGRRLNEIDDFIVVEGAGEHFITAF